jgi:phage baseplate assembly protein W
MASILEFYKKDLAFKGDYVKTASGDLDTVQGIANVSQALYNRLITVKGTLIHRPDYGVGIKNFQNSISSLDTQRQLASSINEQFTRDPRVEKILGVSINYKDKTPEMVEISIKVRLVGYGDQSLSFLPFEDSV